MSSAMTTAGTAAATMPASEACATDWPRADIALACALGLALLGWIDSFLWAHAFGPWWNLIWLGPIVYAVRRTWASRGRGRRWPAWLPLGAGLVVGAYEFEVGYTVSFPWWLGHVVLAALLLGYATWLLCERAWYAQRFTLLVLAVLALPWLALTPLQDFFQRSARLRQGMGVAQVFELFADDWIQDPDTHDGSARTPVSDARLEDLRDAETIIFYPFDAEHSTADGCWTWFEDGRLVSCWPSPD
jgi:hypothetical protein